MALQIFRIPEIIKRQIKPTARPTRNSLIIEGVGQEILSAAGLGQTELINHCSKNVKCSAEKYENNRRSEFIILK